MTVEALIRELQKYVPEAQIQLCVEIDRGGYGFESATVNLSECVHVQVSALQGSTPRVTIDALKEELEEG